MFFFPHKDTEFKQTSESLSFFEERAFYELAMIFITGMAKLIYVVPLGLEVNKH